MYFSLISESFFSDILEEASCSVPTHLDFRSILIVDAIFVILYRRWLYDKYLITSDSEVSLSELLGECWSDLDLRMGYTIEYDEVIAEAVHFREGNSHVKTYEVWKKIGFHTKYLSPLVSISRRVVE